MRKRSAAPTRREVISGGRTAGGKRRARSASMVARLRSSGQGFVTSTVRNWLCQAGPSDRVDKSGVFVRVAGALVMRGRLPPNKNDNPPQHRSRDNEWNGPIK